MKLKPRKKGENRNPDQCSAVWCKATPSIIHAAGILDSVDVHLCDSHWVAYCVETEANAEAKGKAAELRPAINSMIQAKRTGEIMAANTADADATIEIYRELPARLASKYEVTTGPHPQTMSRPPAGEAILEDSFGDAEPPADTYQPETEPPADTYQPDPDPDAGTYQPEAEPPAGLPPVPAVGDANAEIAAMLNPKIRNLPAGGMKPGRYVMQRVGDGSEVEIVSGPDSTAGPLNK